MIPWSVFRETMEAVDFDPRHHHATHWAVQGDCLVNYYPTSGSVYVDGMRKDRSYVGPKFIAETAQQILQIALDDRPNVPGYYWPEERQYIYPTS